MCEQRVRLSPTEQYFFPSALGQAMQTISSRTPKPLRTPGSTNPPTSATPPLCPPPHSSGSLLDRAVLAALARLTFSVRCLASPASVDPGCLCPPAVGEGGKRGFVTWGVECWQPTASVAVHPPAGADRLRHHPRDRDFPRVRSTPHGVATVPQGPDASGSPTATDQRCAAAPGLFPALVAGVPGGAWRGLGWGGGEGLSGEKGAGPGKKVGGRHSEAHPSRSASGYRLPSCPPPQKKGGGTKRAT